MLRWRPRKVDCVGRIYGERCGGSGDLSLRYVDDEEWTVGDSGVGGASALSAPRSWFGGQTQS
jgi:hypothetical protein